MAKVETLADHKFAIAPNAIGFGRESKEKFANHKLVSTKRRKHKTNFASR